MLTRTWRSLRSWIFNEYRLLLFLSSGTNRTLLSFKEWGYLADEGWVASYSKKEAIDREGNPIPWFSYPFFHFLEGRLSREHSIFEYGSGNSTVFFSGKVKQIVSVESDHDWYEKTKNRVEKCSNVILCYQSLEASGLAYIEKPKEFGARFNIIVVDGYHRSESLRFCLDYLTDDGVVILDDTNVLENGYGPVVDYYRNLGFRILDFHGMSSFVTTSKSTSILYRQNNCLGI